jgi:hypothetical protein
MFLNVCLIVVCMVDDITATFGEFLTRYEARFSSDYVTNTLIPGICGLVEGSEYSDVTSAYEVMVGECGMVYSDAAQDGEERDEAFEEAVEPIDALKKAVEDGGEIEADHLIFEYMHGGFDFSDEG